MKKNRNKEFTVITFAFLALFVALIAYFCFFMIVQSEEFINNPYNARISALSDSVKRGNILSADEVVLATTEVDENGNETRVYPYDNVFAHAVGYDSNGKAGVELLANFPMLRSHASVLIRLINDLQDNKNPGDSVVTTLDVSLQMTAYSAMGNNNGAIIAMDPATGKILTMISKPDFDPNHIAENWDAISSNANSSVLLNRTTQGLYPPGSTFKIVTALEYLNEGGKDEDPYDCNGSFISDGFEIHCYKNTAHGQETFKDGFANSCNVVFAQAGLTLDLKDYHSLCEQLLFNRTLPGEVPNLKKSSFTMDEDASDSLIMQTAIGQGDTLVTPYHMALIASAVCNDGLLMEPYMVDRIENNEGRVVKETLPKEYGSILSSVQAENLQRYMRYVVTDGTASALDTESYTAYGKTGTAEYNANKNDTHAWFVGYAASGEKEIALAIVLEGAGSGSGAAVPVAKQMLDDYFK